MEIDVRAQMSEARRDGEALIKLVSLGDEVALRRALGLSERATMGKIGALKRMVSWVLMKRVEKECCAVALKKAAELGYEGCVAALLELGSSGWARHEALREAICKGHSQIALLLLARGVIKSELPRCAIYALNNDDSQLVNAVALWLDKPGLRSVLEVALDGRSLLGLAALLPFCDESLIQATLDKARVDSDSGRLLWSPRYLVTVTGMRETSRALIPSSSPDDREWPGIALARRYLTAQIERGELDRRDETLGVAYRRQRGCLG